MAWFNCNTAIAKFKAVKKEEEKADIVNFFSNVGDVIIPEIKTAITPIQSGSGDPSPSNPRPISGWDSVKVSATGKNFIDLSLTNLEQGGINGNTGALETASNRVRNANYYPFPFDTLYDKGTIITIPSGYRLAMRFYDKNGTYISGTGSPIGFITELQSYFYGKGVAYVKFLFARTDNANITPSDISVLTYQLEIGSIGTTYEPYNGQTVTIPLPHTVYGGELSSDGSGSEGYVRVKIKDLSWTYQSAQTRFYTPSLANRIKLPSATTEIPTNFMCECYRPAGFSGYLNGDIAVATSGNVFVKDSNYTDVDEWLADVGDYYIGYPLSTPTALTTSPVSLNARNGQNNVWSDCGQTSLKYYDIRRATT